MKIKVNKLDILEEMQHGASKVLTKSNNIKLPKFLGGKQFMSDGRKEAYREIKQARAKQSEFLKSGNQNAANAAGNGARMNVYRPNMGSGPTQPAYTHNVPVDKLPEGDARKIKPFKTVKDSAEETMAIKHNVKLHPSNLAQAI